MIYIDDNYCIDVDDYGYTAKIDLHKKSKPDKDGNETDLFKNIGYYSTMQHALKGIYEYKTRKELQKSDINLKTAIETIKMLNDEFNRVVKENI